MNSRMQPDLSAFEFNPNAKVQFHEITDGRNCAIIDDALLNPEALVNFAVQYAEHFAMMGVPPGPRLVLHERLLENLRQFIRFTLCRHFPMYRSGIQLTGCLSNITIRPENLSHLQRLCHADKLARSRATYLCGTHLPVPGPKPWGNGILSLEEGLTSFQRPKGLHKQNPEAAIQYLEDSSEIFTQPPQYMTTTTDSAELVTVCRHDQPPGFLRRRSAA